MFSYFKRFFRHSLIYAIGNIFNRGAGFLLIPLYTRYLRTEGYGSLEIIYSIGALLRITLGVMLAHSLLRFYFDYKEETDKKELVSTALITSFLICLGGALVMMGFSPLLAGALLNNSTMFFLFNIFFVTLIFEISQEVSLAFLRAREQSAFFVGISLVQLISRVALNVYMVTKLRWGIKGILLGNLVSAIVVWFILALYILSYSNIRFNFSKLKALFKYSLPLVGASMMSMVILNSDRFFLKAFTNLSTVGIYAIGYKLAMILTLFVVQPFTTAYGPFRFSIMDDKQASKVYSLVFTYFLLIASFFGLGIAMFSRNILSVISTTDFFIANKIVPIIVLAMIFKGAEYIAQTGIFLKKKTKYISFIMVKGLIVNLALNWLLISRYGMYGGAWALLITLAFIFVNTLLTSQRLYYIRIEFLRIIKISGTALILYAVSELISKINGTAGMLLRLVLLLSFPLVLAFLGFYEKKEKEKIATFLKKILKTATALIPKER